MVEIQKKHSSQTTVQLLKKSNGINPKDAHVLAESIRKAPEDELRNIESYFTKRMKELSIKKPEIAELVRFLKYKVPRSALRWLSFLNQEQKTKVRIATNSTLDGLYSGNEWTLLSSGGCVLSSTILVYPKAGQRMPGLVETSYNNRKCLVYTKNFQGESNIAIAFEDYDVSINKDRSGSDVITYTPKGMIFVIRHFPRISDWYMIRNGSEILGEVGTCRFIQRTDEAWVGPIFRSHETVKEFSTAINDKGARVSLYACPTRKDMFGLVMEAPVFQEKASEPEKQMAFFNHPVKAPQPAQKREFSIRDIGDLTDVVINRTMTYIQNPDLLRVSFHPAEEVGAKYALIGRIDRDIEGTIREIVRGTVSLTYLNNTNGYTAELFAMTFWKICDALGVTNELSKEWKSN